MTLSPTATIISAMTTNEIAEAVQKHAVVNYEKSGWDYIVECWTRAEIAEELTRCNINTVSEAIAHYAESARIFHDRRTDAEAEIF